MATPSGLSRLMQLVNPTLALTPASRILFPKDHHLVARHPTAETRDEADLAGGRRHSTPSQPSARRVSLDAASDPLPAFATSAAPPSRPPTHPSSTDARPFLASEALSRHMFPAAGGWPSAEPLRSPAEHGLSSSAEATMLAVQEESLRRDGKGTGIVHLADDSAESLDAFAARLIQSQELEDAFYILDMGTLDRLVLVCVLEP